VSEADLALPAIDSMLQEHHATMRQLYGSSQEDALLEMHQLCTHLAAAANHDLAGKKTFWVSADLAEALLQTRLRQQPLTRSPGRGARRPAPKIEDEREAVRCLRAAERTRCRECARVHARIMEWTTCQTAPLASRGPTPAVSA
jgi:hypothetical protein